jgi:hypothetical protein
MGRRKHRTGLLPRAKIRNIPASMRPCTMKLLCKGQMTASIRSVETASQGPRPELWWGCETCGINERAARTEAQPGVESLANVFENDMNGTYGPEPINTEMAEASAHIKAIIHEDS